MPINTTILAADTAQRIADPPVTVTYDGLAYTGRRTTIRRQDAMVPQGNEDQYRFSLTFQLSDFPTEPTTDSLITIDTIPYRILGKAINHNIDRLRCDMGELYADA